MNKTININLGGTFFHIDEDAYNKLNKYLEAIKRSITDPQGKEEIIKDIEVRIAELFTERMKSDKQVITVRELDEVIAIMGQPEDYAVDNEIFEDEQTNQSYQAPRSHKKLFRDIDNSYLGGVSSGLGHYLGIDAIWIRLFWVLLTIFSSGIFILFYILFWILVPAAVTVADKLTMTGEPVNISNIEKKVKETYENVADKIKNADYDKYGKKIKTGGDAFGQALGNFFMALFTIFVKFIGVILLLVSSLTLIGLFIGLFITGISGFFTDWQTDFFYVVNDSIIPVWLWSITLFVAIGIPFFALFILGLKILIPHLKPLNRIVNLTFVGLWILSVGALIMFGVQQTISSAQSGSIINSEVLEVKAADTLYVTMNTNKKLEIESRRRIKPSLRYDENDEPILYFNDIRIMVKATNEPHASISIEKKAKGKNYKEARDRAQNINYNYTLDGNKLALDGYFISNVEQKYRGQQVEVTLYLPEGVTFNADRNTQSFQNSSIFNLVRRGREGKYHLVEDGKARCLNCPKMEIKTNSVTINSSEADWEKDWEEGNRIKIDHDGIDINVTDEKDSVKVKINRDGVRIKSN